MKTYTRNHKISPIMISIPHAGNFYPKTFLKNKSISLNDLKGMQDFKCDKVIEKINKNLVDIVIAHCSRAVVDLNRSREAIDEDMFADKFLTKPVSDILMIKSGLGVIPKKFNNIEIFDDKIPFHYAENLLKKYYDPYHNFLKLNLEKIRKIFGCVILLDIHSMPSNIKNSNGEKIDIIIGDNFGKSCSKVIRNFLFNHFKKNNYSVKLNTPYAGGFITRNYGEKSKGYHAVQIEINKNLYLDEQSYKIKNSIKNLQNVFNELIYDIHEMKKVAAE